MSTTCIATDCSSIEEIIGQPWTGFQSA